MKAVAYSIKTQEKECLAVANGKKHDLTLISNALDKHTLSYAQGKEVVIISSYDLLDREMLWELKNAGVRNIITRSKNTTHVDLKEAARLGLKVANAPDEDQSVVGIAKQTIRNLSAWEAGKCVGTACCCRKTCSVGELGGKPSYR